VNVTVLGAGTMGAGIAQACLTAGHTVTLFDAYPEALPAAQDRIAKGLARAAEKGKLDHGSPEDLLAALHLISSDLIEAVAEAGIVIEAVSEAPSIKEEVWRTVGPAAPSDALLCSNTSSLSIGHLGEVSGQADRFCGLHFFNPVAVLPLVEVVEAAATSPATLEAAESFARGIGKTPVRCKDQPGFLVNRLLVPYLNQAIVLLQEGAADATSIDTAMTLGANMPMGPLALADLVGLDVVLAIMETLERELNDPAYTPADLLVEKVRAGALGRKTGQGFHSYGGDA